METTGKNTLDLRDEALGAMAKYLDATGWEMSNIITEEACLYRIDPLTGLSHRADFAFFVQTEREITKLHSKKKKKVNRKKSY